MGDAPEQERQECDGWEWAIVEIMGHRKHAGRVREEERFGTKMLRIDIPTFTSPRTLFDHADGKPEEPSVLWTTHYYSGPSIFSFTLTDEATVMASNKPYEPPARYRLEAPLSPGDEFDEVGEDDEAERDYEHG